MENLGKKAKSKITGFEGTITAKVQYLNSDDQYQVTGKVYDPSKKVIIEWFNIKEIEISEE